MVCRIIWAYRVAPRGAEAAAGYEEGGRVPTKKILKKRKNKRQPNKLS